MSIFTFSPTDCENLSGLKTKYRATATAPLDGMWETFSGMADQFSISDGSGCIGFCAVGEEKKLLQFFVPAPANAPAAFSQAIDQLSIAGAVVSTAEPTFLALCMNRRKSVSDQAIMYHLADGAEYAAAKFPDGTAFRKMNDYDLKAATNFAAVTIGADTGWLESYFGGLIGRGELYGLWQGDTVVATGECRPSATQPAFADVGMIVGTSHRGKGIATNMLRQLISESSALGLKPICSTECSNIAAQKAISKAGFTAYHSILEIVF